MLTQYVLKDTLNDQKVDSQRSFAISIVLMLEYS